MDPITIGIMLMVASMLISSLLVHKQQPPKPAALEEFEFPQVEEGTPEGILFGQCWGKGWQVLWYGQLTTKKIKAKSKK